MGSIPTLLNHGGNSMKLKLIIGTPPTFWDWLLLVFIAAKLFGVVKWSWWIVLSPLWIQLIAIVIALVTNAIIKKRW